MKIHRTFATALLGLTVCFSLAANAQKLIDFSSLPWTDKPLPIPDGYAGMNWATSTTSPDS